MGMRALVTGATGHIGGHVVRACLAAGIEPVAFARPGSDRRALAGLDVELREGDLLDAASLRRACAGVEVVFHVASPHRNFTPDPDTIMRPAVDGTRNVLAAARAAGVRRVVVTSSGATVGFTADPSRPLDERAFLETARSVYSRAKIAAEALARAEAQKDGLEIVTTNPSGVFGPRDHRVTPATAALVGLLQGDPAFLAVCVTDVRDVAAGHVLAAQKGRHGQRYLLTGDVATPPALAEMFQRLAGVKPATFRPPRFLLSFLAGRMEKKAAAAGTDAPLTRAQVEDVFGRHLAYDSTRARRELGATFRPPADVLRDAFRWLLFLDALKPKVAAKVRAALGEHAAPDPDWLSSASSSPRG
ncbi:MAG TPA: NAD-dependent epimerase/dehydratase family protein [Polyangia bacterium]|jgi:dihydroflavonol-4-reductase